MIKWLFAVPPKVGSLWHLRDAAPFDKVLEKQVTRVEGKWVEYMPTWLGGEYYKQTMNVRMFRSLYREKPNA